MQRRRYSVEFKKEAARLLIIDGLSASEVSEKLGIARGMLYRWKSVYLDELGDKAGAAKGASPAEMADEIERLRKALGREKRITEILKKR